MIGVVGLDHHLAPAAVRERVSFVGERLAPALERLRADATLAEVVIVSTCNRTEIYVSSADWPQARVEQFLAACYTPGGDTSAEDVTSLRPYLFSLQGPEAARHLFQVAAGLRSLVPGESQVLAQVKEALQQATECGCAGDELQMLFTAAIKVGKRVRAETGIGRVDASVGATAIARAQAILGSLEGRSALILGAGRTSQLCAQRLRVAGASRLILANRTAAAAAEVAATVNGEVVSLDQLAGVIPAVDLIVSATAAPHLMLSRDVVARAVAGRQRPLLVLDLAIPRDVEASVADLPNVQLLDVDALGAGGAALAERAADLRAASGIIEQGVAEYVRWFQVRQVVPTIATLRRHVDQSEQAELARTLARLAHLSEADQEEVRELGHRLVDKMFHQLVMRIKRIAQNDQTGMALDLLAQLFDEPLARHERRAEFSALKSRSTTDGA
jgi:glutamyl-tRNA reductase